jgi:hypothetical protein
MDKNIAKKPKQTKKKLMDQLDDNNENISIMDSLKNLVVVDPSSSNVEAMLHASKLQSSKTQLA